MYAQTASSTTQIDGANVCDTVLSKVFFCGPLKFPPLGFTVQVMTR